MALVQLDEVLGLAAGAVDIFIEMAGVSAERGVEAHQTSLGDRYLSGVEAVEGVRDTPSGRAAPPRTPATAARQGNVIREQFGAGHDARNAPGRAPPRVGAVEGRELERRET